MTEQCGELGVSTPEDLLELQPEDIELLDLPGGDAAQGLVLRLQLTKAIAHLEREHTALAERSALRARAVSRPFSFWSRPPTLTEISLCHACSCQEMVRVKTAVFSAQVELARRAAALDRTASVTAKARARVRAPSSSGAVPSSSSSTSPSASSRGVA
eukprot:SAG11_NODE_7943_length_1079_cov_1.024490_1_plen_157_part_10